jgi:hypothetical protein
MNGSGWLARVVHRVPTISVRYRPADHGPRMGPKWSDPVRAVILRAESANLPAVGGGAGWSSTRSSRCGKDPGPERDPKGRSWSVQWFLRESAFLPVVGEALGGSSTRSSRCGTSPLLRPPPQYVRPRIPLPVRLPSPAGPEWPMRFPTSRPRVPLARKILRIFRFAGSAPPARKQVIQALQPRLHRGYG